MPELENTTENAEKTPAEAPLVSTDSELLAIAEKERDEATAEILKLTADLMSASTTIDRLTANLEQANARILELITENLSLRKSAQFNADGTTSLPAEEQNEEHSEHSEHSEHQTNGTSKVVKFKVGCSIVINGERCDIKPGLSVSIPDAYIEDALSGLRYKEHYE